MRALRKSLAAAVLSGLGIAPAIAHAQPVTPEAMLQISQPTQKGVEYDTPDAAAIAACKVEIAKNDKGDKIGFVLRDGQGKLLRKFVDNNDNRQLDQWSYYQDGFEVYREVDLNDDKSPDECRWLNAGGSRTALVKDGAITGWKRLSAEETSKVMVIALTTADLGLFQTLFVTPNELKALGAPQSEIDRIAKDATQRQAQMTALVQALGQKGWSQKTIWVSFSGSIPRLLPKEIAPSLKSDIVLYENAAVFVGNPDGTADAVGGMAHIQIPEIVQIGDCWKMVDVPKAVDPSAQPTIATNQTGLRSVLYASNSRGEMNDPRLDTMLKALAEYDNANAGQLGQMPKDQVAKYYLKRADMLKDVASLVQSDDKALYEKQVVDGLAAAYQTGSSPESATRLEATIKQGGKLASYAAFRKVLADYAIKSDDPGANLVGVQKQLLEDLEAFVEKYAQSDEAPDALLQLANVSEFNADEDKARKYFERLAKNYPDTAAGKKAAGALRRLDLVGKTIDLSGPDMQGKTINLSQYRGKTVLIQFWASWAEQARRELSELSKVSKKYQGKGFEIIGVNFDNDKADLEGLLKVEPLDWPQIHEPGGLENRLAQQFGIMSLPTMILVDPQGKVISRTIRTAAELDKQLEKILGAPVALGDK